MKIFCIFILMLFFSCTTSPKQKKWQPSPANQQKVEQIYFGPSTINDNFIENATNYGLNFMSATSMLLRDLNNDGHPDLVWIEDYYSRPLYKIFLPNQNRFGATEYLIEDMDKASFLILEDFNGDNVLDLVLAVHNQKTEVTRVPLKFYRGFKKANDIVFIKQTNIFSLPPLPTTAIVPLDFDLDGDLDLFVANWLTTQKSGSTPAQDYLLENMGGRFVDVTNKLEGEVNNNLKESLTTKITPSFSASVCDINDDGFPDILVSTSHGYGNKLWLNKKLNNKRYFEDIAVSSKFAADGEGDLLSLGGGRTSDAKCADYNNDGMMDVFLAEVKHNYDPESVDASSLLTGQSIGKDLQYGRQEYILDTQDPHWHRADKKIIWMDYNNDGLQDILIDNSGWPSYTRLLLLKQEDDHSFDELKDSGIDFVNPMASLVWDFDRDGRQDIISSQTDVRDARIQKKIFLFKNNLKNENIGFSIKLINRAGNSHAIGARLKLKIIDKYGVNYRYHYLSPFNGNLTSSLSYYSYFGLRADEKLVAIDVRWPELKDGKPLETRHQIKNHPKAGEIIEIVKGNGQVLN